jgi:hypothetical protein
MVASGTDMPGSLRKDVRQRCSSHPEDVETMARILAYTSPALGHLFPFSALLLEMAARGHEIHLRTLST